MPTGDSYRMPDTLIEEWQVENPGQHPLVLLNRYDVFTLDGMECRCTNLDSRWCVFKLIKANTDYVIPWPVLLGKITRIIPYADSSNS